MQLCNQKLFRTKGGRGGHFDIDFVKTLEREPLQGNVLESFLLDALKTAFWMENLEPLQGNILESFLLDTLKTAFWMENLTQRWTETEPFFQKSGHFFFDIQKRHGFQKCSEYARALNIHDHLTCLSSQF